MLLARDEYLFVIFVQCQVFQTGQSVQNLRPDEDYYFL